VSERPPVAVPFMCGCSYLIPHDGGVWAATNRELTVQCFTHNKAVCGSWAHMIRALCARPGRYLNATVEGPKRTQRNKKTNE
jgi:hypothetical protein